MATDPVFDVDALLQPISEDLPAGPDLREDDSPSATYFALRSARSAARSAERGAEVGDEGGSALQEWRTIATLAPAALKDQSKDLEIACWYVEALVRSDGFAGLRDGLKLINGLVEQFWDGLYPLEDEDGLVTKVGPVSGLSGEGRAGTLITPLKLVPISTPSAIEPLATYHYEQARDLEAITDPERKAARIDAGACTMEVMENAIRETEPATLAALLDDTGGALDECVKLHGQFDALCGRNAPSTKRLRDTLEEIRDAISQLVKRCGLVLPNAAGDAEGAGDQTAGDVEDAPGGGSAQTTGSSSGGPVRSGVTVHVSGDTIATREDAFNILAKVSEFFRKTEPHSPISYTLDELVRRGRLPLSQLLDELIPDEEARRGFLMRSGIEPPQPTAQEDGSSW